VKRQGKRNIQFFLTVHIDKNLPLDFLLVARTDFGDVLKSGPGLLGQILRYNTVEAAVQEDQEVDGRWGG
jgi:hypothetical protein